MANHNSVGAVYTTLLIVFVALLHSRQLTKRALKSREALVKALHGFNITLRHTSEGQNELGANGSESDVDVPIANEPKPTLRIG